jgi:hypothetical protein
MSLTLKKTHSLAKRAFFNHYITVRSCLASHAAASMTSRHKTPGACVCACVRECVPVCLPAYLRACVHVFTDTLYASTQRGGDALVNVCACRIKCNTATRRAVTYRQLRRFEKDLCDLLRNENDMKCVVYLYKHRGRIRRAMVRSCDVF